MFDWENEEEEQNVNEAVQRFEAQLEQGEVGFFDSDKWEAIIDHYMVSGNYSKAEKAVDLALEFYPFQVLFKVRKAQTLSAVGKLKEAIELLDEVEQLEHLNADIILTKAAIFSQLRDSKRAIVLYKKALDLVDPEERDDLYLDLASEYAQIRNYSEAIKVLQEAMKHNPLNEGALYEMAFCFDQMGNNELAVKIYTEFLAENPFSFTAWYNIGNTYTKMELFDKSIEAYEFSLSINNRFSPAYFNKGNAELNIGLYNDALHSFEMCVELDGPDPLAFCYIGEAYEHLEILDKAREFYQKSIDIAPLLGEAWLGLGIIKDLEGHSLEALPFIEKALELEPEMDGFFHVYAGALENVERIDDAKLAYIKTLEINPENEDAFFDYSDFLTEHFPKEAKLFIEDTLESTPQLYMILAYVNLLWNEGSKESAISFLMSLQQKSMDLAKEIFIRYPELLNEQELVLLFPN